MGWLSIELSQGGISGKLKLTNLLIMNGNKRSILTIKLKNYNANDKIQLIMKLMTYDSTEWIQVSVVTIKLLVIFAINKLFSCRLFAPEG